MSENRSRVLNEEISGRLKQAVDVRLKCLVPVDRADLCKEIVDNVYGPVEAHVVSYGPVTT